MEQKALDVYAIETASAQMVRSSINQEVVDDYAHKMASGEEFPPVIVFAESGAETGFYLADGFHRLLAAMQNNTGLIDCEMHDGTQRDAMKFALSSNAVHGLRRSNKDKRKAVKVVLQDAEWNEMPSRDIADMCNVSHTFVSNVRTELDEAKFARKQRAEDKKKSEESGFDDDTRGTADAKQSDVTLWQLKEAFQTIAICEIDGLTALEQYGDELGEHLESAGRWLDEARTEIDEAA